MKQDQQVNKLNRCAFCRYRAGRGCMVTPNSHYCTDANNEYYQWLRSKKTAQPAQKSLRSWDKR